MFSQIMRSALVGTVMALSVTAPVQAQNFPDKPIQLIVPFAAGSVTDVIARAYGVEVAKTLGQPVVVENRVGASGMIAAQAVARSKADGYTLLFGTNSTNAANVSLFKKLPYDQENDFTPAAQDVERLGDICQGQSDEAQLRRSQFFAAHCQRNAECGVWHQDDLCALQEWPRCCRRRHQWADRGLYR
jgi:tripartite-type tricarboxylate transporter receptor subunit TctC